MCTPNRTELLYHPFLDGALATIGDNGVVFGHLNNFGDIPARDNNLLGDFAAETVYTNFQYANQQSVCTNH